MSFTSVFGLASQVVNDLMPVYLIPFGISLALLVLGAVAGAFKLMRIRRY